MSLLKEMHMAESDNRTTFDCRMYGALLRHKRMEVGYRKADDFVADLKEIGYFISRAALYRVERGEQEPPIGFIAASNLVLFGSIRSVELIEPCVPQGWCEPPSSDEVMRVLKKNGALSRLVRADDKDTAARAAAYEMALDGLNAYDFNVFVNAHSTDDELYMSVAIGADECSESGWVDCESYEVNASEDIERAVINFLKTYGYELPGTEVVKLVDYAYRKVGPVLAEYEKHWAEN